VSAIGYDLKFAVETIWKVALASLILGAGLPVLFATGIRSLAWGTGGAAEVSGSGTAAIGGSGSMGSGSMGSGSMGSGSMGPRANPMGKVVAGVIFFIVAYAIVSGIVYIIATGKGSAYDITFKHFIPEIYKKAS
jgi:hypothetical protein